jgi:hypothetical protein
MRMGRTCALILLTLVSCWSGPPPASPWECCYPLCVVPLTLFREQLLPLLIADGIDCELGVGNLGMVVAEVRGTTMEALKAREKVVKYGAERGWRVEWPGDNPEVVEAYGCPEHFHPSSARPTTRWVRIAVVEFRVTATQVLLSRLSDKGIANQAWLGGASDVVIVKMNDAVQAAAEIDALALPGVKVYQ